MDFRRRFAHPACTLPFNEINREHPTTITYLGI